MAVPDERDFGGTADERSNATGDHANEQTREEVSRAILGKLISEHLEQAKSRGGVEDLTKDTRPESIVQRREPLLLDCAREELEKRRGWRSGRTRGR